MIEFLKSTRDIYLYSEFNWDNPLQYESGGLEILLNR